MDWLAPKYEGQALDLIVAVNFQSVPAALAYRQRTARTTPILSVLNPHDLNPDQPIGPGIAGLEVDLRPAESIRTALALLPDTEHVAVIGGGARADIPTQRVWIDRVKEASSRVDVIDISNLPLEQVQQRVAQLPPRTICLLANFEADADGRPTSKRALAEALLPHSNAPMFDHIDVSFGYGTVGGWMASLEGIGAGAGQLAAQMLQGAPVPPVTRAVPGSYRFDSRQLRRWGISESRLPAGSIVEHREPAPWERYRSWLLAAMGALATLLALLFYLVVERWWRARTHTELRAELAGTRKLHEISHWNRLSALGQLTSSLAHEINQPISAILANTEAVRVMVQAPQPDVQQIGQALADVRSAGMRAAAVIENLRALLRKNPVTVIGSVDVSEVARETVQLIAHEAAKRAVHVELHLAEAAGQATIDRTQLQQVILNLLSNALDAAAQGAATGQRWIRVRTQRQGSFVQVEVEDSGPGIPPARRAHLFEPFQTTKPEGLGVGLAISRTIVVAAHGDIALDSNAGPGALFRVSLPSAGS